jgi:hypothetical protein
MAHQSETAHTWPLSEHLRFGRMDDRGLSEAMICRTVQFPHRRRRAPGGKVHYFRAWRERGGLYLRVIVDPTRRRIVSAYFDRSLGRREYPRRSKP